jgi:ABC-type phosphate/phosphonate transport system substrate-binding protein
MTRSNATSPRGRTSARRRLQLGAATAIIALLAGALAACGGSDSSGSGGSKSVSLALTAPTIPANVNYRYGPLALGSKYGLSIKPSDFTTFTDSSVATQTVLSGKNDVVVGSFLSLLALRSQGQDFKAFCPFDLASDYIVAGTAKVKTLEDLRSKDVTVGIDSPGGAVDAILSALFKSQLNEDVSGASLPNTKVITSSGLRATSLATGELDATFIHLTQLPDVQKQNPGVHIVAKFWESVPLYLSQAFSARASWLKDHADLASSLCASLLDGSTVLSKDEDLFMKSVDDTKYVEQPTKDDVANKQLFDLISQFQFWPVEGHGFEPERIAFMLDVAKITGVLKKDLDAGDIVDQDVYDKAVQKVADAS